MNSATRSSTPGSDSTHTPGTADGATDQPATGPRPLLSFLRRPAFSASVPGRLSVWHWLGWMCLLLLVAYLGNTFTHFLAHALRWPVPAHSTRVRFLSRPSWAVVPVLLVAPALEELGFRAFLSTAPRFVFFGLAFFLGYGYLVVQASATAIPATMPPMQMLIHYFYAFWVFAPAGAIAVLLYRFQRQTVLAFFRRRAGWIFWGSCLVFGAAHATLYTNHWAWWALVLALPQFLLGIGLAYLRVSFGLRWSIASHYAIDIPAVLGSWAYLSAPASGPLHTAEVMIWTAIVLAVIVYGAAVLWRVSRRRW